MHDVLFTVGRVTVYTYGLMIALGVASAVALSMYRAKKRGLSEDTVLDIAIYGIIFGMIGAKLLFLITEIPALIKEPALLRDTITSGFVLYGGLIGGIAAAYVYCRIKKTSFMTYFDLVAPSIALAQAFGRIGCFFAGCCYGKPTSLNWNITFQNSRFAPNGEPLIPTQLYSSAGDFTIMAILLIFARKQRKKGQVAGLYMILYSIGRFIIEFLRDDPRGSVGFLSTSQFICIFVLAFGIAIFNFERIGFLNNKKAAETDIAEVDDTVDVDTEIDGKDEGNAENNGIDAEIESTKTDNADTENKNTEGESTETNNADTDDTDK